MRVTIESRKRRLAFGSDNRGQKEKFFEKKLSPKAQRFFWLG